MSKRTYTAKDMPDIETTAVFEEQDEWRKDALAKADAHRAAIEAEFPPAPGWYWIVGVDGELFLKEDE